MNNVIRQVRQDIFKEEHPRYFLFIDHPLLPGFTVQTEKYIAHFEKVVDGVFMTRCRGRADVIGNAIEKLVGHSNFFLTEMTYTPMDLIAKQEENYQEWLKAGKPVKPMKLT